MHNLNLKGNFGEVYSEMLICNVTMDASSVSWIETSRCVTLLQTDHKTEWQHVTAALPVSDDDTKETNKTTCCCGLKMCL